MIRIKHIYIILFVIALLNLGITVSLADISGYWKLGGGFGADTMGLKQSGNHVYGTYSTPQGLGAIDGYIYATNIWRGWWHDPLGDGHFMVTFSYDFNSFSGSWGYRGSGLGDGTLQGDKVVAQTAKRLHPGVIKSKLLREGFGDYPGDTPEKGARTSIYLASSPKMEDVSGKYFENQRPARSSDISSNRMLQERLWKVSDKLTGLD